MDTTKNNKLMAEFMEWNKGENYSEKYPFYDAWNEPIDQILPSEMLFNKSWDWLIPVVEKIEKLRNAQVDISYNWCRIGYRGEAFNYDSRDYYKNISKIEAVYGAVVEFIKWYNENN